MSQLKLTGSLSWWTRNGFRPPEYSSAIRMGVLDQVFLAPDLRAIPSAWGHSWPSLSEHFRKAAEVSPTRSDSLAGGPVIPSASFDLTRLAVSGTDADFATVEAQSEQVSGAPDASITVSWVSATERNPPRVACVVRSPLLVLPLGAQPRWLLSKRAYTGVTGPMVSCSESGLRPQTGPNVSFGPGGSIRSSRCGTVERNGNSSKLALPMVPALSLRPTRPTIVVGIGPTGRT
jgi:hypothetical protein